MTNNTTTTWKFKTADETAIHHGKPTDSRGLRLRAESGYGWVHMGTADGWLQLSVAIRKLGLAERMVELEAKIKADAAAVGKRPLESRAIFDLDGRRLAPRTRR